MDAPNLNYKNKLLELAQKRNIPTPTYSHKSNNRTPLLWQSTVDITTFGYPKLVTSGWHIKKTSADIDCSEKAYNIILEKVSKNHYDNEIHEETSQLNIITEPKLATIKNDTTKFAEYDESKVDYILWIDLDGCMEIYNSIMKINKPNIHIRGYGGMNLNVAAIVVPQNCYIETATTHRRDIADYMLAYDMTKYILKNYKNNVTYVIVSRDASLENLKVILKDDYKDIHVEFFSTFDRLLTFMFS